MAGQLPSFLSGSNVIIRIGEYNLAYCQDLRFSRSVGHVPVRGIGSYGTLALEPVDFAVNGSLVITRWTGIGNATDTTTAPDGIAGMANESLKQRGNSLFTRSTFNPATMILSATFDIYVYPKGIPVLTAEGAINTQAHTVSTESNSNYLYQIKDCRLTNYSFSFFPGQLLNENATFVGRTVIDNTSIVGA